MINDNIFIKQILNMTDEECDVTDFRVEGHTKYITIEKRPSAQFCPLCGCRLYSKGKLTRHPNNPILQDGYELDITLIGRRWKCPSTECTYTCVDQYSFIEPGKKNTKLVPLMIVNTMKDIHLTCRQVADRYNVSDTYVHETFMRYVSLSRLPLSLIISIDEVYLNISPSEKYAVVIMDFTTGQIIDIVSSRWKDKMESYWLSIPKEERDSVCFLISDMYNPYINYTQKYFKNAISIIDSFHVIKWINSSILTYINQVKKRYLSENANRLKEKNQATNRNHQTIKQSRELYILTHAKWVLLADSDNIIDGGRRYNYFLKQHLDSYDWIKMYLDLDPKFPKIRELKQLYEDFNKGYINDSEGASKRLDELINIYKNSDIYFFRDFSKTLKNYKQGIINSFIYTTKQESDTHEKVLRRMSNGPMESFNNVPSSFRSQSHGIDNFEFVRNRILWSNRDDAGILGIPKSQKEVHTYTTTKRGKYKK